MAPERAFWVRALLRAASHRATDAEIGDVMEEYAAAGRSAPWLVGQMVSAAWRRRSHLTLAERGAEMLSNLRTDIRYTLRTLRRSPGFALAAILPIALGIGINTGVFSVLNSVAWRPLPVPGAEALVSVHQNFRGGPRRIVHGARSLFSLQEYHAYRDATQTLSGLMAYSRHWTITLGRDAPQEIEGILVTCNYFEVLGVRPAIGTGFTPANCGRPDAPPAVVLSHALWRAAFAGDPGIVEAPIVLNGRQVAVVGVAPAGFDGVDMARASFFAPTEMASVFRPEQNLIENAHVSWLTMIGRRAAGADLARVRADLAVVAGHIDRQQPGRTTALVVEPAAALSLPAPRQTILRGAGLVMAAFGLLLLIAAANVANMLLARAAARTREVAIRISVGASRGRLVQQLLTESAIIALAGGVCGSLLFRWWFGALVPWLLAAIPEADRMRVDATPDRTVLWFALGLTAVTTLLFGLVPALQASKSDVHALMKQDGAGTRRGGGWLRGMLIGAQVALCTMLLIPAGLLSRALHAAHALDPGFDHHAVAVVSIDLRNPRYDKGAGAIFHDHWLERIRAVPGVERVAEASRIPLSPGRSQTTFRLDSDGAAHAADVNTVSPDFFPALGLPIVRGRLFTHGEPDVLLVTESTAGRYWPGQDAVGRRVIMDGRPRQVVGIVRDALLSLSPDAMASYVFLPGKPATRTGISVVARTRLGFDDFAAAVRSETISMDANLVVRVRPLSDNLAIPRTLSLMTAGIAATLSLLALGLAAIGIYGVVAYVVTRRRREVGIRLALGASVGDVRRLMLEQTLRPVAAGMAIGIAIAAAAARVLQSVLFGVSPFDLTAYLGGPLLLAAVAVLATWLPTRRALQTDPLTTLRAE